MRNKYTFTHLFVMGHTNGSAYESLQSVDRLRGSKKPLWMNHFMRDENPLSTIHVHLNGAQFVISIYELTIDW